MAPAAQLGWSSTCLACVRRLVRPVGLANSSTNGPASSMVQVRHKSNSKVGRLVDRGVCVRLLEDIPEFGPKELILRTERGRMRNTWYPRKMAEYMTISRFAELGLTQDHIGERDHLFGTIQREDTENTKVHVDIDPISQVLIKKHARPNVDFMSVSPTEAHALLLTLVPHVLVFPCRTIRCDAIFGSVSTADIAAQIKSHLAATSDASSEAGGLNANKRAALIQLDASHIKFVGDGFAGTDRVKALGNYLIDIHVPGSEAFAEMGGLHPIRTSISVQDRSKMKQRQDEEQEKEKDQVVPKSESVQVKMDMTMLQPVPRMQQTKPKESQKH